MVAISVICYIKISTMKINSIELKYNNPIGEDKLDEIISLLDIKSSDTIVDIGGGTGSVLVKMIQDSGAKGILIDLDEKLIEQCRKTSKSMLETGQLTLIAKDAKAYIQQLDPESVDCFVCVGASHVFDDYLNLMKTIIPYLKPGGFILAGEEFWAKKPAQEYLDILGAEESESGYHYENIEGPEKLGLTYLYSHIASQYDWNKFEGIYFLEEELKALDFPATKRKEHLEKLRSFRGAQFKFGRSTMGFGLYLFAKDLKK